MLEDAEVLVDSDSLSQLKAEYNIVGSARTTISAHGSRAAAQARNNDFWDRLVDRYPFMQVRPNSLCDAGRVLRSLPCVCLFVPASAGRVCSGYLASVCSGSGLRGERVRAWDPLPAGDAGRCDQANPRGPSCTPSVNRLEALGSHASSQPRRSTACTTGNVDHASNGRPRSRHGVSLATRA